MAAPLFNPGLFDQNTTVLVTPATTTNQPLEHENYIGMTCASTLQTGGTYSDSVGSSTSFPTFAPSTVKLDGEEILWDNAGHNGTTRMRCPRCQTWVATGSRRVVLHSLRAHMGGNKCRRTCATFVYRQERENAQNARRALFSSFSDRTPQPQAPVTINALAPESCRPSPVQWGHLTPVDFSGEKYAYGWESEDDTDLSSILPCADGLSGRSSVIPFAGTSSASVWPPPSTSVPHPTAYRGLPCRGIPLDWPLDNIFQTYPWQRHSPDMPSVGYHICAVEERGTKFRVRSDRCVMPILPEGGPCSSCLAVMKPINHLANMAKKVESGTNRKWCTHKQLCERLQERDKTLKTWKLKRVDSQPITEVESANQQLTTALASSTEHKKT